MKNTYKSPITEVVWVSTMDIMEGALEHPSIRVHNAAHDDNRQTTAPEYGGVNNEEEGAKRLSWGTWDSWD